LDSLLQNQNIYCSKCYLQKKNLFSCYTKVYSCMATPEFQFNKIYKEIIAKSLFTNKQLSIISNRLNSKRKVENISRGAYYRQLKQCRKKIVAIFYSLLLLKTMGVIDNQALTTLQSLTDQLALILSTETSNVEDYTANQILLTTQTILKRIILM
jgi:hypothetical protein